MKYLAHILQKHSASIPSGNIRAHCHFLKVKNKGKDRNIGF
jgi:hypothetical protein